MSDDYFSLAQLTRPQMMPNAPIGGGAMAGLQFGKDANRQDEFIRQAASLAQLDAMMKAQAAEENMAGAPGRMDDIQTKNALAAGKRRTLPSLLSSQQDEATAGADMSKAKTIQAEMGKLAEYSDQWDAATSAEDRASIKADMAAKLGTIGPRRIPITSIPDDRFDEMMSRVRRAREHSVKQAQSLEKVEQQNQGKLDVAEVSAAARERAAEIGARARQEAAKAAASGKTLKWKEQAFEQIKTQVGFAAASDWLVRTEIEIAKARGSVNPKPQYTVDMPPGSGIRKQEPNLSTPPPFPKEADTTPVVTPPAPPPKSAPPKAISKEKALERLQGFKGTKQYEQAVAYYKFTYGEDPPK